MNSTNIDLYISYCFDLKNINILYIDNDLTNIKELKNYTFKSIKKFNPNTNYTFNDILILSKNDLENIDLKQISTQPFKIMFLGDVNIGSNEFKKNNLNILFKSSFISKIIGKQQIVVAQKKLNKNERFELWNYYYGYHLDKLYGDKKLELVFSAGHKYISNIDKRNLNVVDFGCGSGYHAKFENLNQIKNYYFIDSNSETIDYLKNKKGFKNVIQSNGTDFKLNDNSIDYFICSHILEHIPNLEEVLNSIYKKLKNGGSIILVAPCDPGILWNFLTKFTPNRLRLKRLGLDYEEVMKSEHVNSIYKVQKTLRSKFKEKNSQYFPFNFLKLLN